MADKTFQDIREQLQKVPEYNNFQQVVPMLFIGPQTSMMKIEMMQQAKIKNVLKVNDTLGSFFLARYGINVKQVQLEDMADYELDIK